MRDCKLYFFPYAGASDITFKELKENFQDELEFEITVYAGHGNRKTEKFNESVQEICEDLYGKIKEDVETGKDVFFMGHCLGGIIALELCYLIRQRGEFQMPRGIFISGQGIPTEIYREHCDEMGDKELLQYLYDSGAIGDDLMNENIFDFVKILVLNPIKADARIYDSYEYEEGRAPLDLNACILYGEQDKKYEAARMKEWQPYFTKKLRYLNYQEGHFFINSMIGQYKQDVCKIIDLILQEEKL